MCLASMSHIGYATMIKKKKKIGPLFMKLTGMVGNCGILNNASFQRCLCTHP